jgi:hypothetical protein
MSLEAFYKAATINLMFKSKLEKLYLGGNDIEGKEGCDIICKLVPQLTKLVLLNIEGNMMSPMHLIVLKNKVDSNAFHQIL